MNDNVNELANAVLIFGAVMAFLVLITGGFGSTPKCVKAGCDRDQAPDSSYCYLYKPYTGSSSYSKKSGSSSSKKTTSSSSSSSSKSSSSSSGSKKTTSNSNSKSYSTSKTVEMPDCDDYDDYDDFMDDWDGCMPDGSDAEDYWENW